MLGLACSLPLSFSPAAANQPNVFSATPTGVSGHVQPAHLLTLNAVQHLHTSGLSKLPTHTFASYLPPASGSGANLNLTSNQLNFLAGNLGNFASLQIDVGGRMERVDLNSRLTAAELVAYEQVAQSGTQTITLAANGVATGGSLVITTGLLNAITSAFGGSINALVVGHGLRVTDAVANLDVSGKFANYGTFLTAAGTSGGVDQINAQTITNGRGAQIGSATGGNGLYAADPALNASTSLTNAGVISGLGNVAINTPVLNNSGLISAGSGNVSLTNTSRAGLTVNGMGGVVQATSGSINVNSNNGNINLNGGNWLSQNLNLDAGTGSIVGSVGQVTGVVNSIDNANHFTASTPQLILGTSVNSGDPTYVNASGGIVLSSAISDASGDSIAIVAAGDITVQSGSNVSITTNGDGGTISLIAGATVKQTSGAPQFPSAIRPTDSVTASYSAASGGGSINLTAGNTLSGTLLDSSSASGNVKGGNVTLVAFRGTNGGGTIDVSKGAINTYGSGTGNSGNITIIAPGAISTGALFTTNVGAAATGTVGSIAISNANPTGSVTFNGSGVATGSYKAGALDPAGGGITLARFFTGGGNFNAATTGAFDIVASAGASSTSIFSGSPGLAAGNVTISAGSVDVQAFGITAHGAAGSAASASGTAGMAGGRGGNISMTTSGNLSITGDLVSTGGNGGAGTTGSVGTSKSPAGQNGGAGGSITLSSTSGNITTQNNVVSTGGAGGTGLDGGTGFTQSISGAGGKGGAGGAGGIGGAGGVISVSTGGSGVIQMLSNSETLGGQGGAWRDNGRNDRRGF